MGASFDLSQNVMQGSSGIYKIGVLLFLTVPQTLDFENSATASRWCIGVVSKICRWSSLWITRTTVERVVTECTSLLYVG